MKEIRGNLFRMYIYKFLSEFYLIMPVLIPYYRAGGLADTQVFLVQAIYTAAILLLEIPSGYFADVWGRRTALVLGALFLALGLGVYSLSAGFWGFACAEILLAVGNSMRSGTDVAMIYDSLRQIRQTERYAQIQGRMEFATRIGTGLASICGGLLALVFLRLPFYVNIIDGLIMTAIALTLVEPERERPAAGNPWRNILRVVGYCLREPLIRKLMVYWAVLMSSGIIGIWAYFLHFRHHPWGPGFFGVLFALFQICAGIGSHLSHRLEKRLGRPAMLLLPLLIGPAFALIGGVYSLWLVPVICLNGFLWNIAGPTVFTAVNARADSSVRATTISTINMCACLVYVLGGPLFGRLSDAVSLSRAFVVLGLLVVLIGGGAAVLVLRSRWEAGEPVRPIS